MEANKINKVLKLFFLNVISIYQNTGFSNRGATYIWVSLWQEFVLDKN